MQLDLCILSIDSRNSEYRSVSGMHFLCHIKIYMGHLMTFIPEMKDILQDLRLPAVQ